MSFWFYWKKNHSLRRKKMKILKQNPWLKAFVILISSACLTKDALRRLVPLRGFLHALICCQERECCAHWCNCKVSQQCGSAHVFGTFFHCSYIWWAWLLQWAEVHQKQMILSCWIKTTVERVCLICMCWWANRDLSSKQWQFNSFCIQPTCRETVQTKQILPLPLAPVLSWWRALWSPSTNSNKAANLLKCLPRDSKCWTIQIEYTHVHQINGDGSFLEDEDFGEGWWSILALSLVAVETDAWCAHPTALWTDKDLGWEW